jgi:hypothetical protein
MPDWDWQQEVAMADQLMEDQPAQDQPAEPIAAGDPDINEFKWDYIAPWYYQPGRPVDHSQPPVPFVTLSMLEQAGSPRELYQSGAAAVSGQPQPLPPDMDAVVPALFESNANPILEVPVLVSQR